MKKTISSWSVEELRDQFPRINFPEYQREPNLWSLLDKRRLIDSMVRQFDIASLYFYEHDDLSLDCVDGRQRISTIMAFLGSNPDDRHERFSLQLQNEYSDDEHSEGIQALDGLTFEQIKEKSSNNEDEHKLNAREFVKNLLSYPLSVVKLSDSQDPAEFNLQFTRLNLGTIINSGEKLNAMVGDIRDECFEEGRLGFHDFLNATRIPTRRFAREQVAAQILAQVFSLEDSDDFCRTRHVDLQKFFKQNGNLSEERRALIQRVRHLLDILRDPFGESEVLRNRAITVSTVLLAWRREMADPEQAEELARFIEEFQYRLRWQIKKGFDIDQEYRYLLEFQRHLTQASVEKPAFSERARILEQEFDYWVESNELTGDAQWKDANSGENPSDKSRESS